MVGVALTVVLIEHRQLPAPQRRREGRNTCLDAETGSGETSCSTGQFDDTRDITQTKRSFVHVIIVAQQYPALTAWCELVTLQAEHREVTQCTAGRVAP